MIGRQSIGLNGRQMDELLRRFRIPKREGVVYETENKTVGVDRSGEPISQESFFAAFTDAEVKCLDVSAYEQADIVFDLQRRVPWRYRGYADFIYNGSCLDNIFDPAAALRNMTRLLKRGGRVYHYEQGNSHPTAYLKYSADWFMDFYALNRFADCKTYILDKPNSIGRPLVPSPPGPPVTIRPKKAARLPHDIVVYHFDPYVKHASGHEGYDCSSIEAMTRYEIHCIAEKGRWSTVRRKPIQKHYRVDPWHQSVSVDYVERFRRSPRPVFRNGEPFDAAAIGRIDSSDYPGLVRPVAVIPNHM